MAKTRINFRCEECGYPIDLSLKWIKKGLPRCYCTGKFVLADDSHAEIIELSIERDEALEKLAVLNGKIAATKGAPSKARKKGKPGAKPRGRPRKVVAEEGQVDESGDESIPEIPERASQVASFDSF